MIKIGIIGYGNLAKGAEQALSLCADMELKAVFSRRSDIKINTPAVLVEPVERLEAYKGKLDAVICCGGSATDLMTQTPLIAKNFNFVDSFDTHAKINQHFKNVDEVARANGTSGIISAGWDPGLFSIQRLYGEAVLPKGSTYTFWGKGVSQGHSDAIRRISGVLKGVQYTVPVESALNAVRSGAQPDFTAREKHKRVCYVVAAIDSDKSRIEKEIVTMPDYFADYDTTVNFISEQEFAANHLKMPHGGRVFRTGSTGDTKHTIEYSLNLESNPEFTGSVLAAYARAAVRLSREKAIGARTVLDVPPAYLSPKSAFELYGELL